MAAPTLRVYFAFGDTWKTALADFAWDDETVYVRQVEGLNVGRGRSSELDEFRAGYVRFVLNNADRRFDPSYSSSPHNGNLVPGVPVKVTCQPSGQSEVPIFTGYVEGWPQDYALGNTLSTVAINAVDAFGKLATAGLPSSVYAIEVAADSPAAWWRMNETQGDIMADTAGGYHGEYLNGQTRLTARHPGEYETVECVNYDGQKRIAQVNGPGVIASSPVTVEFLLSPGQGAERVSTTLVSLIQPGGTGFLLTYGENDPTTDTWGFTLGWLEGGLTDNFILTGELAVDGKGHHVAYRTTAGGAAALFIDGEAVTPSSDFTAGAIALIADRLLINADPVYPMRGPFADLAIYDSNIGNSRIQAHAEAFLAPWDGDLTGARLERILDAIGWPADLRSIATGLTTMGPATLGTDALTHLKRVERSEQGRLFMGKDGSVVFLDRYYNLTVTAGSTAQATFSDDGSDIPYASLGYDYDDRLVKNRIRGSRTGGGEVEVFDQTSIDTYGERVDSSLNSLDLPTEGAVQSLAELRLNRYKDPSLRVRPIEIKLHGLTAAQQATVLGLELGYRVNVERTPQGVGSAIDQDTIIESISHRIGGGEHIVTLALSPVDTTVYGLWDSGLWDTALWAA